MLLYLADLSLRYISLLFISLLPQSHEIAVFVIAILSTREVLRAVTIDTINL